MYFIPSQVTVTRTFMLGALLISTAGFTASESKEGLEEVVVTATPVLKLNQASTAGSRLGLTPLETPASVSVTSGDLIREMNIPSLLTAKTAAPGITANNSPGNGVGYLSARGFSGQNSVKQLFNGMEIYNAGGVVSFPSDPWNVERIETLYGPASVLYGTGAIGGAVNVVPRRPDNMRSHQEVAVSGGSFNTYHEAFDSTGPLGAGFSYRLDVSHYSSKGWVDRGDSDSLAVSASLRYDASPDLHFTLANDYGRENPSQYLGTPVVNGVLVPGLEKKNYNLDDARLNFGDNWTTLETEWTPSSSVAVHNNAYAMYHDRIYHDVTVFTYVPATRTVRRTSYRDINDTYQTQYGDSGYVKINGNLFGRKNNVLVGFDANKNYYHRNDNNRGGTSTVDAYDFNPGYYADAYQQVSIPFYRMHLGQYGGFLEERLNVTDRLTVVAGVRQDHYDVRRYDNVLNVTTNSDYNSTGWNIGMVFNPVKDFALYGQYAQASDPVNSLASIGISQQSFDLSPGRQIEVGAKQSLWEGGFEWTLAAYKIIKQKLLTPTIANPSISEQVGQQSSRGIEASAAWRFGAWRLDLNGTVLKAQFDDFSTTVNNAAVSLRGNVPVYVPEQTANARLFFDVSPAWQLRAAARYVGKRYSDNTNSLASTIPSYTVADVGVRWAANEKLKFDLSANNVTDEIYADSGSTTQWILGAPRNFTLAMNVTF